MKAALGWSVLQLLAILGDVLGGAPFAVEQFPIEEFFGYLFLNRGRVDILMMVLLLLLVVASSRMALRAGQRTPSAV